MITTLLVPVRQLLFRRASGVLLTNIQRTLGNALAESRQALGLYDNLLGKFRQASMVSFWTSRLVPIEFLMIYHGLS